MQLNNALIAAAVTAALAASANVTAETTVYGKIHTSVASVTADAGTSYSATEIKSNASRLGFKSSKKLENGMTFKGQIELEIDAAGDKTKTSTEDLLKLRNTYVGLQGGFGEVRVGMHDTPHKISTSRLDVFGDTYADYNNIIQNDNRVGNVVAYLNQFGPVGIAAAYAAGDDSASATGENANSATSVMVNYSASALYLSGAVESFADVTTGIETATKVGVGYKIAAINLGLVYETLAMKGGAKDESETYISAKYKMNDTTSLKAAYGMRDDGVSATNDEVMTAVGVDYKMDKQASVYALFANGTDGGLSKKGKLAGDGSALALGFVYKF